jgi:hypothetical protein
MWGYGQSGNGAGQGVTKTMHDPCPPGYRVMDHLAWYNNGNGYTGDSTGGATLSNEDNYHNGGIVLTKDGFTEQGFAWYPYTGYRDGGSGAVAGVGSYGRIATCMPYKTYNTRYFYYDNEETYQERYFGSAGAQAVRCQQD